MELLLGGGSSSSSGSTNCGTCHLDSAYYC